MMCSEVLSSSAGIKDGDNKSEKMPEPSTAMWASSSDDESENKWLMTMECDTCMYPVPRVRILDSDEASTLALGLGMWIWMRAMRHCICEGQVHDGVPQEPVGVYA